MTQGELAAAVGYKGNVTIYRLEKGASEAPNASKMAAIATALRVSLEWLYTGETAVQPQLFRDDANVEWSAAVDAYLQSDYAEDGIADDIVEQLRAVDHKSFRLRPGVLRDVDRARRLLEEQKRALEEEAKPDSQGYGLARKRRNEIAHGIRVGSKLSEEDLAELYGAEGPRKR